MFSDKVFIDYDVLIHGILVSETLECDSIFDAMRYVRELTNISVTIPIIYSKGRRFHEEKRSFED
jgi:hypothetical protein